MILRILQIPFFTVLPRSKRASVKPALMIFEVLFVIAVAGITIAIATQLAESQTVTQTRITQDIAMLVNAAVATPGEVLVEYPANLTQYTLILTSDTIMLRQTTDGVYDQTTAHFYLPVGYVGQTNQGLIEAKQHVCIHKKERVITLQECPASSLPTSPLPPSTEARP